MKKRGILVLLFIAALLLLPACGSKKDSGSTSYQDNKMEYDTSNDADRGETDGGTSYGNGSAPETPAAGAEEAGGEVDTSANNSDTARKRIIRKNLSLETLVFDDSLKLVTEEMQKAGGYVESSSVYGNSMEDSGSRSAQYVLRIPAEKADSFIKTIGNSMNIVFEKDNSEDITLAYVDTESKLKALTIEQERLLLLLEKSEKIEDIIALEERLSTVRYELEQNASTLRTYDNLVDYATITLDIKEVLRITPPETKGIGGRISTGLKDSLLNMRDGFVNFTVWFIVNLPYILFWALILGIIVLVYFKKFYRKNKVIHPVKENNGRTESEKNNSNEK